MNSNAAPGSNPREVVWVGSSLKDLRDFPEHVKDEVGAALQHVQWGRIPPQARPLKGFSGASVLEIRADHDGDTYRAIYTVRFGERIYVLHAFKKKSRSGVRVDRSDSDLIQQRLRWAEAIHREWDSVP